MAINSFGAIRSQHASRYTTMDDDFFDLPEAEKAKSQEKHEPGSAAPDFRASSPQEPNQNDGDYPAPNPDFVPGMQQYPQQQPAMQPPSMPYSEEEARSSQYKAGFNDGYYTGYTNAMRDHPSFNWDNDRRSRQSFTFGLISIFTIFIPFISIAAAVAAIVMALQSRNHGKFPQRSLYGLILGITASVLMVIALVIAMTYLQTPEGQQFMENFYKS
ncbi:MAG: hypothetical protein J5757_09225 [Lachnospiraceae bacterium]|nr:hypothetical protein [Lachnospiraceae bacterium]